MHKMTKVKIYIIILISTLSLFIFTYDLWIIAFELGKPSDIAYIFGTQLGLTVGLLLWYQYHLGVRGFIKMFTKDLLAALMFLRKLEFMGYFLYFCIH